MSAILLVDDNRYVIEAIALTLSRHIPYGDIFKASNGRDAAGILTSVPVDLILTDLSMPIMDGYGLIEYRNRNFPEVPVMVMTGDPSPPVLNRLHALGVTTCLDKPVDFDLASHLIRKALVRQTGIPVPRADAVQPVSV